ncbi:MAG TPA: DUF6786 family protein, partial [Rhodothermales bacterium]|nr:DUF6786 family protein [Rhodothermales bacterium]
MTLRHLILSLSLLVAGCVDPQPPAVTEPQPGSFAYDLAFLEQHTDVLVLSDSTGSAQVAVVPSMQGRVMTSTVAGPQGLSLGWINYDLVASGDTLLHINPYGGEDRFWLGPEGGQFSIFFKAGDPFDLDHWFTPAGLDTEPFEFVSSGSHEATFQKSLDLENYSGTRFNVDVVRTITVLDTQDAASILGVAIDPSVQMVAFASENTIRNAGEEAWKPESGLLSVWILGMFNPSPATTVAIPFETDSGAERGDESAAVVNDAYFGEVPDDRLVIADSVLFFKGDGEYRSKIGLTADRATDVLGSYDAANNVLTIAQYNKSPDATRYVNSMWEVQDAPYAGDVINSYNDGPLAPGEKGLGPFYELETSSPAAALAPGEELTHVHRTFHFQGPEGALDSIARHT